MSNRFLVILAVCLTAWSGAQAATVDTKTCELEVCKKAQRELDARIRSLEAANMPAFLPMVEAKNLTGAQQSQYCSRTERDDGACLMTQKNAIDYCVSVGAHLPSARELAQLSRSQGAKGILSDSEYVTEKRGSDKGKAYQITAKNLDEKIDNFNFSYAGYQRPSDSLGNHWFWSSSVNPYDSYYAFYFYGVIGVVDIDVRDNFSAVRCVAGR